jgi:ABC-2 type transport system ATP-binding protein
VQRICSTIALIHRGEIRLFGELDKLEKQMGGQGVVIETGEPVSPLLLSEIAGGRFSVQEQTANLITLSIGKGTAISDIVALLVTHGVKIEQVHRQQASLEDIYTTILKEAEQKSS